MELEKFYRRINKKMIDSFINDKQEEHLTLEFKTVKTADLLDKQDKKNFAEALSGFANSSGGVIVWGIETKKIRRTDYATGTREIQPLSKFMPRLNQLTGDLVKPIVEGVLHGRIRTSVDGGFAKTLILPSDAGPHMAMGGVGRYYKRSGDSFYPMEHFDIEDMFGRRKKPKLSLYLDIKRGYKMRGPGGGTRFECQIFVGIVNDGRGIAKHVELAIEVEKPCSLKLLSQNISGGHDFLRLSRPGSKKTIFSLGADVIIHPKSSVIVTLIAFEVSMAQKTVKDVVIDYEIMAEDMQTVEGKEPIKGEDIKEKIVPRMDF